jgi:two-component system response regulator AtoC
MAGALQLIVVSRASFAHYELPPAGQVVLGRAEQCDLRIEDPSVTRRHAVLHIGRTGGERLELEDLGSVNGTRVRQQRLEPGVRVTVHPGEAFYVGSVLVMIQTREASGAGVPQHAPDMETKREEPRTLGRGAPIGAAPPLRSPAASAAGTRPVPRVVDDPAMRALDELVDRVAAGTINVLVLGESGAGKELVAERLHASSPRRDRPLLRLNCAALPESVLEAEWFGYERGAFTGAAQAKAGLLESANGGTVFLDEIGEMALPVQAKILRVIEARETMRLGALRPRPLDVRFVAATNRSLEDEVRAGRFRQDLFYRLNGVALRVPPLRERPGEIAPLAEAFITHAAAGLGRHPAPRLRADALLLLQRYTWPGNVRELRNFLERAVLLASGPELTPEHFPLEVMAATLPVQRVGETRELRETSPPSSITGAGGAEAERERILRVLAARDWLPPHAAKELGIARSTLVLRLNEYGVTRPQKR